MKKKALLKPLDVMVIMLGIVLTVAIGGAVYSGEKTSSRVIIRGMEKTWIYPLDAEVQVNVAGSLGETVIRLHNGQAMIVSSPCSAQTCVAAGELSKNGQWAACLPNRVFVLVEGTDGTDAVDAASF